jgi:hypothetical protein
MLPYLAPSRQKLSSKCSRAPALPPVRGTLVVKVSYNRCFRPHTIGGEGLIHSAPPVRGIKPVLRLLLGSVKALIRLILDSSSPAMYVSSYSVLVLIYIYVSSYSMGLVLLYMCPHTLLYMCPHALHTCSHTP